MDDRDPASDPDAPTAGDVAAPVPGRGLAVLAAAAGWQAWRHPHPQPHDLRAVLTSGLMGDAVRRAWEDAPFGMAVLSPGLRFLWINRELARQNGRSVEDHLGRPLAECADSGWMDMITPLIRECLHSAATVGPEVLSAPPGQPILAQTHVAATYVPIVEGDRVQAVAAFITDITPQVQAQHRVHALERFAEGLAASVTDDTLRFLLAEVAELLGASAVALGEVVGDRLRIVTHGIRPHLLERLRTADAPDAPHVVSIPLDPGRPGGAPGGGERIPSFTSMADAGRVYPELNRFLAFSARGPFCLAPIVGPEGGLLGVMQVVWPVHPRVTDLECHLVEAFAALAGQALERTRLAEEARARAGRARHRTRLAEGLATARTPDQVAAMFADAGLSAMGAHTGAVYLLRGGALHLIDYRTISDEHAEAWSVLPLEADVPVCRAARTGVPELLRSREEIARAYPHLIEPAQLGNQDAWVVHPIRLAGVISGAVSVAFPDGTELTDTRLLGIEAALQLVEDALERTTQSSRDHRVVLALQDRVTMGSPDRLGDYRFGYGYRPAELVLAAGGDWLDVRATDAGEVAVLIGDIVGHGLEAVLAMTELRSAAAALIAADPDPDLVHERLNRASKGVPGTFCSTLIYSLIGRDGQVRFVRAGHPPPVAQDADGVRILERPGQPPLGIDRSTAPAVAFHLEPGARMVLYTDGLIERRDRGLDDGLRRLAEVLGGIPADTPPGEVAHHLLATLLPEDTFDDAAVLVVQRDAATGVDDGAHAEVT
ncbi:MAG: SpoIIE family protein phosphatase [Thermoleophilia bacterium]